MAHDQDITSAYELIYTVAAGKNYQREAHDIALGETGTGIRHWTEEHTLTLFTNEQYHHAIQQAGLRNVEWLPGWQDQRPRVAAIKH